MMSMVDCEQWAFRVTAPRDSYEPRFSSARHESVHSMLVRHRRTRSAQLDRDHPFSWPRCALSIFSYALLLSDVIRTGLGIRTIEQYPALEPDSALYFGPYAYPGIFLTTANATAANSMAYWMYKYDTTSIAMRAVVSNLGLPDWPPCVTYQEKCDESGLLSYATVFGMLDALIEGVSKHHPDPHGVAKATASGHISLRAEINWYDRLHHYVFPWFFQRNVKRTISSVHYAQRHLDDPTTRLCGSPHRPEPSSCTEMWTNYRLTCPPTSAEYGYCSHVDHVWGHMTGRVDKFRHLYANYTVDLLVLDAVEDYARPGVVYQGRKYVDVVSLIRVRDCSAQACKTIAIDDYRYEAGWLTTSAFTWYGVIATTRAVGQAYAWIRIAMLIAGCYYARLTERVATESSVWSRLRTSVRTVFLIPSQVVIYGSVFPITCYVIAHLLDSAAVYELSTRKFRSILGDFQFNLVDIITVCSVSMRSVWIAAIIGHVLLAVHTHRSWSPANGVPGVPEYSVSFIASLTVFAQVRRVSWRDTNVLQTEELLSTHLGRLRSVSYDSSRGFINQFFFGATLDPQCLSCAFLLLVSAFAVSWILARVFPRFIKLRLNLLSHTSVPMTAGKLWIANALVITWFGGIVSRAPSKRMKRKRKPSVKSSSIKPSPKATKEPRVGKKAKKQGYHSTLVNLDERSPNSEAMVYLMNLAIMTDPIAFLQLRVFEGRLIGLYESRSTKRCFLLPYGLASSPADLNIDWDQLDLLLVINSKDLNWWELLQCG